MHPKLLFILLFSLATNAVFSQADSLKTTAAKVTATVFKKNDLPSNLKVAPEIFYIINDKPVSREEFLKQKVKKQ